MDENRHLYHIFITLTYDLNFLMKFGEDDIFIIATISTKFHEKYICLVLIIFKINDSLIRTFSYRYIYIYCVIYVCGKFAVA